MTARRILPWVALAGIVLVPLALSGDGRVAAVLGIVQGLAEFLPISSSAHLILVPWLFGWDDPNAFYNTQTYDVALHMGTLLALVAFFGRDWLRLLGHAHRPQSEHGRLFWLLVLASLPGAAIGFVLNKVAADFFRDKYLLIADALAVMGAALFIIDSRTRRADGLGTLTRRRALLIGLAQALAFVPGVSRSGSTMTTGRALGLSRETAARFSFLMAMPITAGAGLLKLTEVDGGALRQPAFWLGIGTSFVTGTLVIGFLLSYLRRNSFLPFVVYRLALAVAIVAVVVARG